ncbi:hypothetical protein IKU74_03635 [bacterium]|nr:hypothetical protein [bacterium]
MSVSAVNNYEKRNPLSTVITSTAMGGVVGYGAKYAISLTDREKKDINYKAIVNASRKDVNLHKANSFKVLKNRTEAQDAFIKLVDNKEPFKNPTLKDIAERIGGQTTEIGKKVLGIINDDANKNIDLNGVINALGKDTAEAKEVKRISKLTNVFASENIAHVVKSLGGEESNAGKEFRRIIKEVDQDASKVSRKLLQACHKVMKEKRYTAPLIIAGAAAGFATAFVHNVLSTKTEA